MTTTISDIDSILIRNNDMSIFELKEKIDKGIIIFKDVRQYPFIYPNEDIIIRALMRIPIQQIFFTEDFSGKYIPFDENYALIKNILNFLNNERALDLKGELSGKIFNDLPMKLQTRIENAIIPIKIIDLNTNVNIIKGFII